MKNISINIDSINKIDIDSTVSYIEWCEQNKHFFTAEPGKEHYKFLAYMSSQLNDDATLVDIGTYFGFSAAALSQNEKQKVITYDIFDWIPDETAKSIKNKENIDLRIMDCTEDIGSILESDFICLDVSPHDGFQEMQIYNLLKKYKYKGILYVNNLNINAEMKQFIDTVTHTKIDVTKYAHFTGSSLIVFDTSKYNVSLD
jgi:predicted O-methyltransferase YrrM